MVEETVESRQPFRPLFMFFHSKKQPLAQLPQLGQLLLQHLIDVQWEWVEGFKENRIALEAALQPSLWS